MPVFCALIKTKSAHDKLQSIKNAWSKDEICCLEMAALLTQGNSESDKYRFNTAFLTGSDYYRYPKLISEQMKKATLFAKCLLGTIFITATEFIFGCIFNLKYSFAVWDYSNQPFNVLGQICLPFSILWFFACFVIFKWVIKDDFYRRLF